MARDGFLPTDPYESEIRKAEAAAWPEPKAPAAPKPPADPMAAISAAAEKHKVPMGLILAAEERFGKDQDPAAAAQRADLFASEVARRKAAGGKGLALIGDVDDPEALAKRAQEIEAQMFGAPAPAEEEAPAPTEGSRLGKAFRQGEAGAAVRGQDFARDAGAALEEGVLGRTLAKIRKAVGVDGEDAPTPQERAQAMRDAPQNAAYRLAEARLEDLAAEGFEVADWKDIRGLGSLVQFMGENVAASLPQMAVTVAAGPTSPAVTIAMLGGEANAEMKEKTPDLPEAERVAIATGAGTAMWALETLGLGKVLGGLVPSDVAGRAMRGELSDLLVKEGLKRSAARIIEAGIAGGSTEALQEGIVMAATAAAGGEYERGEVVDRLSTAFAAGSGAGSAIRGTGEAVAAVMPARSRDDEDETVGADPGEVPPAPPAGPLEAAERVAPAPQVEAPEPEPEPAAPLNPKFPDMKPGKEVRIQAPDGLTYDAVFVREGEDGVEVRVGGEVLAIPPQEFDAARVAAKRADEEAKQAAKVKPEQPAMEPAASPEADPGAVPGATPAPAPAEAVPAEEIANVTGDGPVPDDVAQPAAAVDVPSAGDVATVRPAAEPEQDFAIPGPDAEADRAPAQPAEADAPAGLTGWDASDEPTRRQTLIDAGFVTKKGNLNPAGRKALGRAWADLSPAVRGKIAPLDEGVQPPMVDEQASPEPAEGQEEQANVRDDGVGGDPAPAADGGAEPAGGPAPAGVDPAGRAPEGGTGRPARPASAEAGVDGVRAGERPADLSGGDEFVTIRDVYGDTSRVRAKDLASDRPMLRRFNASGDPIEGDGALIARGNIDADGSGVAETWKDAPVIGIGKAADRPAKNKAAVRRAIEKRGQKIEDFEVREVKGGFIGVRKAAEAAPPESALQEQAASGSAQPAEASSKGGAEGNPQPVSGPAGGDPAQQEASEPPKLAKPAPKRQRKPKAPSPVDRAENFYRPDRIVPSYGGGRDKVLAFERTEDGGFTVQVQKVDEKGEPSGRVRTHATLPEPRELAEWERGNPVGSWSPEAATAEAEGASGADGAAEGETIERADVGRVPAGWGEIEGDAVPRLTDEQEADLRRRLDALGLGHVRLTIDPDYRTSNAQGNLNRTLAPAGVAKMRRGADGAVSAEIIIAAAVNAEKTLDHEAIHVLRHSGLFTKAEWSALEAQAESRWIEEFNILDRYPTGEDWLHAEEAIAEAFAAWRAGRARGVNATVRAAFQKILRVLRAVAAVVKGSPVEQAAEDVFARIEKGRVARRRAQAQPRNASGQFAASEDLAQSAEGNQAIWSRGLKAFFDGRLKPSATLRMGDDFPVFRALGARSRNVVISAGKLRKVMREHPEITRATLDALPTAFRNPKYVLESSTEEGRWVTVVVEMPDGKSLVVPVDPDGTTPDNQRAVVATSIYVKDDPEWVSREIAKGKLLYARDGAPDRLRSTTGSDPLKRPRGSATSGQSASRKVLTRADVFKASAARRLLDDESGALDFGGWKRKPAPAGPAASGVEGFMDLHAINDGALPGLKRTIERMRELGPETAKKWLRNLDQGVANQFSPIRALELRATGNGKLPEGMDSAFKSIEIAVNDSGRIETLLRHGAASYDENGAFAPKPGTKGLLPMMEQLGSGQAVVDWMHWMAARRAAKLKEQGIKTPLSDADIRAGMAKETPLFRRVARDWKKFNDANLDFAVASGLVAPKAAEAMKADDTYIPFYRADPESTDDLDPAIQGPAYSAARGVNNPKSGIRAIKGGERLKLNNLVENMILNSKVIVAGSMRNMAADKVARLVESVGEGEVFSAENAPDRSGLDRGYITFKREGKEVKLRADDPAMVLALAGLRPQQLNAILRFMADVASFFRQGITLSPAFMVRNLIRGAVSTGVLTGKNLSLTNNTLSGLKQGFQNTQAAQAFKARSGMGDFRFGGTDIGFGKNDVLIGLGLSEKTLGYRMRQLVAAAEHIGTATELADRIAVQENLIRQGVRPDEASYQALNIINYGRRGSNAILQTLLPLVPFLNARIQGLARLLESPSAERGWRNAIKPIMLRGAVLAAISVAAWGWNNEDEEKRKRYEAEPLWRRLNYHIIYDGERKYLIPKAFEIGVLFGTIPELMLEAGIQGDTDEISPALTQTLLNTFSFNPTPAAVLPLLEVASNYDFFTGREIEGARLASRLREDRTDDRTSSLATTAADTWLASVLDLSPVVIQHLLDGYGGVYANTLLAGMDMLAADMGLAAERPEGVFGSFPGSRVVENVFGSMVRPEDADPANRFIGEFYDLGGAVSRIVLSAKDAHRVGDVERARDLLRRFPLAPAADKLVNKAEYQMGKLNSAIRTIRADRRMDGKEKAQRLKPLIQQRNILSQRVVVILKQLEKRQRAEFSDAA